MLAIVNVAPAFAYNSCGNVLGGSAASQSLIDNTAKFTITPQHGTIFYIDSRRGIDASYVAYKVTNTATTTKKNIWVKISNFAAASGNSLVSLTNPADNLQQIPSLASNASYTVYFLLAANKATTVDQAHTIEIFNGDPRLAATGAAATGCDYTFNRIDQTIAANANKVTSVSVSTTTPVLGGTFVITVNGSTGTAGAGDASGDADVMWISPASVASWPTRALRLESTQVQIKRLGKSVTDTFTNTLVVMDIDRNGSNFTSKTLYTATYTFRVTGGATTNPIVKPVAQIASGTQMKHTGSYSALPAINLTSLSAPITVTKSAAATAYTPTACNATTKFAVRYTITARLASGTVGTLALDELVDVPPSSGAAFDTQANQATYSDATPVTNAALGSPSSVAGESPAKLRWTGPFYINSSTPAVFKYTMCVDKVAGTYQNTAYGYVGNTIVGSNSLQVSCEIVTSDGTSFTLSSGCSTAKPAQPQTITFPAPDPVGAGTVTPLYATSTSGLPVVFTTSSASSICTVALNGTTGLYEVTAVGSGTCVINANQPGNANFSAATQVSQNLTIKPGQIINVSTTANMTTSTTQNFTATSLKQSDSSATGLAVTVTSLTPTICTVAVNGSVPNFRVTSLTTTGTCSLVATQPGDATYGAASDVYIDINVGGLQTINFTNPGNQTSITSPASPITISATSVQSGTSTNTNLLVAFSSLTPDVCDISTGGGGSYVTPTISGGVSSTTLEKFTAGICTLVASQEGSASYAPATDVQVTFTIGQPQVITFTKPTDSARSANTKSITASTTSSLLITFTSATSGICTVATGTLSSGTTTATVTFVSGGTCVLTASQTGNGSWYTATPVTQTFVITGATVQTVTFTQGDVNINTSPITLSASASSGLPVTFISSTTSVCSVSEVFVTLSTVGNCTIVASQSGDLTYAAATNVTVTFVIFAKPTTTFTQANVNVVTFPENLTLASTNTYAAAAGSTATGLTVTYTSTTTSVCEVVSGATISLKTVGTCTIAADQGASSPTYLAADTVTRSFTIASGQAITFNALTSVTYGVSNFNLSATSTSGLTVSFALTTGAGICSLVGDEVSILAAGSCSFTASQAGNASYAAATPVVRSLTVNKKPLTFTATAANKVYNRSDAAALTLGALVGVINSDAVSIDAAQVSGAFNNASVGDAKPVTVTVGASVLTGAKAGNYSATVSNSPTANITAKPITMTIGISNKVYDGTTTATRSSSSLNDVESGDTVTIDTSKISAAFADPDKADGKGVTVTLASGALTGASAANYTVTVAGSPTANITARPVTVTAENKSKSSTAADPTFTYHITSGSLVSRLGVADTFSGSLTRANLGTNTAGTYAITTGTLALSSNYSLTVVPATLTISSKTVPSICWSAPAAITYGTAISATELNALARTDCATSSDVAGTFVYLPASGAVLTPGTHSITVTFTPTDGTTYDGNTETVSIVVNAKPITVTAEAKTKVFGATDPALTYTVPVGALVGSDTLTGALARAAGSNVGTYAINAGTLTDANNPRYVITFSAANFSITEKSLTISADNKSITSGGATPTFTFTSGAGELVGSDALGSVTFTFSGSGYGPSSTAPTAAGTFINTPSAATFTSGLSTNYLITYTAGTYAITAPAPEPAGPTPNPPSKAPVKPVVVTKTLPVKKVTLTSKVTSAAPLIIGMITSTTGSTSNTSSLAPVPNAVVREAIVVGGNANAATPATPNTPNTPTTSGPQAPEQPNSNAGGNSDKNSSESSSETATQAPQVIQVIDNKPAFVNTLSSKIAISFDMEESKTQVRDDRAIVQLNTNTGQIRVQPLNGWTGVLKVPTYMATDEAIVEIENVITVNPDPTPKVLVRPTSITRTALGWTKSPTDSVQKYEVRVNGKLVCETAATTCAVNRLIGPKTQVDVTAIGNEGTRSTVEAGKYSPNKRVKVFTINFDEEKWEFTPTAIRKLNTYIDIIKSEGFTEAFVLGYTDSQGSPSTSMPLSRKRATVTTKYLKDRLPEILFRWFAFGEADPLRKGLDPKDFAANRRAEIYVR